MAEQDQVYQPVTKEIAEQRRSLAPKTAEAFKEFSRTALRQGATAEEIMEAVWVAAEMRAGGAYAHSALALNTMTRVQNAPVNPA